MRASTARHLQQLGKAITRVRRFARFALLLLTLALRMRTHACAPHAHAHTTTSFDEAFDLDDPDAQRHLERACTDLKAEATLQEVTCYLDTFKQYLAFNTIPFPVEPIPANGQRTHV